MALKFGQLSLEVQSAVVGGCSIHPLNPEIGRVVRLLFVEEYLAFKISPDRCLPRKLAGRRGSPESAKALTEMLLGAAEDLLYREPVSQSALEYLADAAQVLLREPAGWQVTVLLSHLATAANVPASQAKTSWPSLLTNGREPLADLTMLWVPHVLRCVGVGSSPLLPSEVADSLPFKTVIAAISAQTVIDRLVAHLSPDIGPAASAPGFSWVPLLAGLKGEPANVALKWKDALQSDLGRDSPPGIALRRAIDEVQREERHERLESEAAATHDAAASVARIEQLEAELTELRGAVVLLRDAKSEQRSQPTGDLEAIAQVLREAGGSDHLPARLHERLEMMRLQLALYPFGTVNEVISEPSAELFERVSKPSGNPPYQGRVIRSAWLRSNADGKPLLVLQGAVKLL